MLPQRERAAEGSSVLHSSFSGCRTRLKQAVGVAGLLLQCSSYPGAKSFCSGRKQGRSDLCRGWGVCELRVPEAVLRD